jgi:voltage-gated potassium channel Kch
LFFISVGASINFMLFIEHPFQILAIVLLLVFLKFVVLLVLGRFFRLSKGYEFLFAFLLAQSSEFAFVLISFSRQSQLFDDKTSGLMLLVVTLSMALSPLLLLFNEKAVAPILARWQNKLEYDEVKAEEQPVILAGFGRFGLVVGRLLLSSGYKVTIIDSNPANVEILRKFGFKLYYGDVTRPQVLENAGIAKARLLILSMAEYDNALKVAEFVRNKYPDVRILARAKDIYHAFEFIKLGVKTVRRELFYAGLELGAKALEHLGFTRYEAYRSTRFFKHHEEEVFMELYDHWTEDKNRFIQEARRFSEQLSETLVAEKKFSIHKADCAWDVESIRKEAKASAKPDESG